MVCIHTEGEGCKITVIPVCDILHVLELSGSQDLSRRLLNHKCAEGFFRRELQKGFIVFHGHFIILAVRHNGERPFSGNPRGFLCRFGNFQCKRTLDRILCVALSQCRIHIHDLKGKSVNSRERLAVGLAHVFDPDGNRALCNRDRHIHDHIFKLSAVDFRIRDKRHPALYGIACL